MMVRRRHTSSKQQRHPHRRRGLSLLEIVLALAIFFGALAVLSQLAWNGARAAVQARLKTQAIIRCEAKLAEVLAGYQTLSSRSNVPFNDPLTDNTGWTWSMTVYETSYPDLLQVDLSVSHSGNSKLANVEYSLRRWMRDPALFQNAALQKKQSQSTNSTSSSTSNSSSSSSSSTSR